MILMNDQQVWSSRPLFFWIMITLADIGSQLWLLTNTAIFQSDINNDTFIDDFFCEDLIYFEPVSYSDHQILLIIGEESTRAASVHSCGIVHCLHNAIYLPTNVNKFIQIRAHIHSHMGIHKCGRSRCIALHLGLLRSLSNFIVTMQIYTTPQQLLVNKGHIKRRGFSIILG